MCESWIATLLIVGLFIATVAFGVLWWNARSGTPTSTSDGTVPERDRTPEDVA